MARSQALYMRVIPWSKRHLDYYQLRPILNQVCTKMVTKFPCPRWCNCVALPRAGLIVKPCLFPSGASSGHPNAVAGPPARQLPLQAVRMADMGNYPTITGTPGVRYKRRGDHTEILGILGAKT